MTTEFFGLFFGLAEFSLLLGMVGVALVITKPKSSGYSRMPIVVPIRDGLAPRRF